MSSSTTIEMSSYSDAILPGFKGGWNGEGGHAGDEPGGIEAVGSDQEGDRQRIEAREGWEVFGDECEASQADGEASEAGWRGRDSSSVERTSFQSSVKNGIEGKDIGFV